MLKASFVLVIGFAIGVFIAALGPNETLSTSDSAQLSSENEPELSIGPRDEPQSVPAIGSSLFDKIFSKTGADGKRAYAVPFPFNQIIKSLRAAAGGVTAELTLFPMGRSLQRSAAIEGMSKVDSLDPYYEYPRVVIGYAKDSVNSGGRLSLNLGKRMYVGMNERAKLLEVISYNDEAGRFEYQIVRDYEQGKSPQVFYASRQLCLQCHQNQTPIFSRGPWPESNANEKMSEGMISVMTKKFPDVNCSANGDEHFCRDTKNPNNFRYFGVPLIIDSSVTLAFDKSTKDANEFHAYHKIYQRLCPERSCRQELLRQIFLYKLTDAKGLLQTDQVRAFNRKLSEVWNKEFANGLALPQPEIRDRDPLLHHKDRGKIEVNVGLNGVDPNAGQNADQNALQNQVKKALQEVVANSDIPGEFEPLLRRPPSAVWKSAMVDGSMTSRLVDGYSKFFTNSDAQFVDQILSRRPEANQSSEQVQQTCKVKRSNNVNKEELSISCGFNNQGNGIQFSVYLFPNGPELRMAQPSKMLRMKFPSMNCDLNAIIGKNEQLMGSACYSPENVIVILEKDKNGQRWLYFYRDSGVSLRYLDGRRLLPISIPTINPGEEKVIEVVSKLNRDAEVLGLALAGDEDNKDQLESLLTEKVLNRISVLNFVMRVLKQQELGLAKLPEEMANLPKKTEAEQAAAGLNGDDAPSRALMAATKTCGACHYNHEGVPPNFLGGPGDQLNLAERCRRLATCSARMLFRLKMWECPESDFEKKKTPMPPIFLMQGLNADLHSWIAGDRVQLHAAVRSLLPQAQVIQHISQRNPQLKDPAKLVNDLMSPTCPQADSELFEALPRCDNSLLIDAPTCIGQK